MLLLAVPIARQATCKCIIIYRTIINVILLYTSRSNRMSILCVCDVNAAGSDGHSQKLGGGRYSSVACYHDIVELEISTDNNDNNYNTYVKTRVTVHNNIIQYTIVLVTGGDRMGRRNVPRIPL